MDVPERHVTGANPEYEARCPAVANSLPTISVMTRASVLTPIAGMEVRTR
jgi:hypothetical protein